MRAVSPHEGDRQGDAEQGGGGVKDEEDMFKRAVNVDAVPIVIEGKDEKEVKVKVDAAPQKAFKVRPQIVSDSI